MTTIIDCVIRNIPNTAQHQRMSAQLRGNITGLKLRKRGRGARNRYEHQELPMTDAPRFSAYYQSLNPSGGHGNCSRRIYFDWLCLCSGYSASKPHLKLGAKTW